MKLVSGQIGDSKGVITPATATSDCDSRKNSLLDILCMCSDLVTATATEPLVTVTVASKWVLYPFLRLRLVTSDSRSRCRSV